jgi:hypothetical protein
VRSRFSRKFQQSSSSGPAHIDIDWESGAGGSETTTSSKRAPVASDQQSKSHGHCHANYRRWSSSAMGQQAGRLSGFAATACRMTLRGAKSERILPTCSKNFPRRVRRNRPTGADSVSQYTGRSLTYGVFVDNALRCRIDGISPAFIEQSVRLLCSKLSES